MVSFHSTEIGLPGISFSIENMRSITYEDKTRYVPTGIRINEMSLNLVKIFNKNIFGGNRCYYDSDAAGIRRERDDLLQCRSATTRRGTVGVRGGEITDYLTLFYKAEGSSIEFVLTQESAAAKYHKTALLKLLLRLEHMGGIAFLLGLLALVLLYVLLSALHMDANIAAYSLILSGIGFVALIMGWIKHSSEVSAIEEEMKEEDALNICDFSIQNGHQLRINNDTQDISLVAPGGVVTSCGNISQFQLDAPPTYTAVVNEPPPSYEQATQ